MEVGEIPVSELIKEVNTTAATSHWTKDPLCRTVVIRLPHECRVAGMLFTNPSGREMHVADIYVPTELQNNGIGTRLLKCLAVEAKNEHATSLSGFVVSEAALRTRARVFGKENLSIRGYTYEDALRRSQETGETNYSVTVDLTRIDTSKWEMPKKID